MTFRCLPLVLMIATLARALPGAEPVEVKSPLEPVEAQKLFQLADSNLRIELAAAEPEVIDPVAIRFDEDGRMWVCEMRDYPLGPPPGSGKTSRIRVLEDTDHDGRFEKVTTFADGLSFVTGVQPWKGGVFVTLSGAVAYMKDTDGDGKCDLDETWFEGFSEQNTQLRANHPRLALDNWIYVANGLRGGKVISRKRKEQGPIDISGMDFRFDPLTGKAEAVSGNGQFGLTFDDWGNRFICSNRNPCMHVVIEDRYLKANPGVTVPAVVHNVAAFAENSRIYPISRAWTTSNLHAGQFTAACGVHIYRGDLLPKEFYGNVFTCDPTGNLVHREIMQPAGPTFTSKPAYEGKEFLASPDEWFRPVNLELGPGGALYVVDMYRCVIEHPDFVPDELKQRPDQRLGDDRGRIWRIVGSDRRAEPELRARPPSSKLSQSTSDDLLPLLGHANAWHRDTAQRLVLERGEVSSLPTLVQQAKTAQEPLGRMHAYWTLAALEALDGPLIDHATADRDAAVRRQGLLLAERSAVGRGRISRVWLSDGDRFVRFQAQLSLLMAAEPPFTTPITDGDFQRLEFLIGPADDPWERISLLLLVGPDRAPEYAQTLLSKKKHSFRLRPTEIELLESLAELSQSTARPGAAQATIQAAVAALFESQPEIGVAALAAMARRWDRGQGSPKGPTGASLIPAEALVPLIENGKLRASTRSRAAVLLAYADGSQDHLVRLLDRREDQALRIAAIAALARQVGTEHWESLLDDYVAETPPVRRAIVDGLLANIERTRLLLDALESSKVAPSELDAAHVTRLSQHRDAAIKERAAKLFAAATPAERAQALADYQVVLTMKSDAKRGQAVFEKNCAACHKIAGIGTDVAPDISDSRTKKLDQLLGDILLPNRAIDNNYIGYNVRLLDGTVATGILKTETSTSITLRQQGGKEAVIPRSEIDELKSSGQSLMPEGLERQIPHQDMADLLSFIKNWRYLDGRTPLSPQ